MSGEQVYALFVDIMGFADAIDRLTPEEHDDLDEALRSPANWPQLKAAAVDLATSYTLFHSALTDEIAMHRLFVHSAMIFSDSAYVISGEFRIAQHVAQAMMTFAYGNRIPLRAGIGYGNFARLIFSTASHPSGALIADSPFLGSAIVRAYRAQACPATGFRIFLHPSVLVKRDPPWMFVEMPPEERSDRASLELNFLHESIGGLSCQAMLSDLADMRRSVRSEGALRHYDGSRLALQRLHETGETHGWKF